MQSEVLFYGVKIFRGLSPADFRVNHKESLPEFLETVIIAIKSLSRVLQHKLIYKISALGDKFFLKNQRKQILSFAILVCYATLN